MGSLTREIGQTLLLLGLMASVTATYVGVGLLAIRVLG